MPFQVFFPGFDAQALRLTKGAPVCKMLHQILAPTVLGGLWFLVLTCMTLSRGDFDVQNVIGGTLARDVQSMGVYVGGIGILHCVPLPARVRPL